MGLWFLMNLPQALSGVELVTPSSESRAETYVVCYGWLRVQRCMQVSRLSDNVRAKTWNQLVKIGLDQTLSRCISMLENRPDTHIVPVVDEYRLTVLAQLNVMEMMATNPTRVTPSSKAGQSGSLRKAKIPRSQSNVKLKTLKKKSNLATDWTSKSTGRAKSGESVANVAAECLILEKAVELVENRMQLRD